MPLTIEHSLKRILDSALQKKLLDDVTREPNFAEKADKLLTESDDIAAKRRTLSEQKDRLLQIRERLLEVSVEDDDDMINELPSLSSKKTKLLHETSVGALGELSDETYLGASSAATLPSTAGPTMEPKATRRSKKKGKQEGHGQSDPDACGGKKKKSKRKTSEHSRSTPECSGAAWMVC